MSAMTNGKRANGPGQVGLVTLGLGLLRLGFLDVVLSKALLRGFVTAIVGV